MPGRLAMRPCSEFRLYVDTQNGTQGNLGLHLDNDTIIIRQMVYGGWYIGVDCINGLILQENN